MHRAQARAGSQLKARGPASRPGSCTGIHWQAPSQGELYPLTTSPSGRARPLGEVVKGYNSLKTGRFRVRHSEDSPSPITQTNALLTKVSLLRNLRSGWSTALLVHRLCDGIHRVSAPSSDDSESLSCPRNVATGAHFWRVVPCGLRNGTVFRMSNPKSTRFKGVVPRNHVAKWPRASQPQPELIQLS